MYNAIQMPAVVFPEKTEISDTRYRIDALYRRLGEQRDFLRLDFSQSKSIDSSTLLFVLYLIRTRERRKSTTTIRMPRNGNAYRIFCNRQFDESLFRFTNKALDYFIENGHFEDLRTGDDHYNYHMDYDQYLFNSLVERLDTAGFFSIKAWAFDELGDEQIIRQFKAAASEFDTRWSDPITQHFIQSFLNRNWIYRLCHIDFSALRYFFLQQTASTFACMVSLSGKQSGTLADILTLTYSNDGRSVLDVMKEGVKSSRDLLFSAISASDITLKVDTEGGAGFPRDQLHSSELARLLDYEASWILIALLPRIPFPHRIDGPYALRPRRWAKSTSTQVTLNYLIEATTSFCPDAEFILRSGEHIVSIRREAHRGAEEGQAVYRITLRPRPSRLPVLALNRFEIHIPMQKQISIKSSSDNEETFVGRNSD